MNNRLCRVLGPLLGVYGLGEQEPSAPAATIGHAVFNATGKRVNAAVLWETSA